MLKSTKRIDMQTCLWMTRKSVWGPMPHCQVLPGLQSLLQNTDLQCIERWRTLLGICKGHGQVYGHSSNTHATLPSPKF